jgi:hypothetical protein
MNIPFLVLNGIIAFFSDIILNILSHYDIGNINTLLPYFKNKSTFKAALYATITVIIIVIIIMNIFKILYGKTLPENNIETIKYLILTFIVGYIADVLIHKLNIFPKLDLYYKTFGSGLWGGLAICFSVIISLYIIYLYNEYYRKSKYIY